MTRDEHALAWWRRLPTITMTLETARALPEYSVTNPTGVTPGKMWRRHNGAYDQAFIRDDGVPRWVICRYENAPPLEERGPTGEITVTPMCKVGMYRLVVRRPMNRQCPTCKSKGFEVSVLGPTRCTFCDGTDSGNPPERDE